MQNFDSKEFKRSRFMYVLEAALEYFIALLVSGSYLATLTRYLGISDSLTGIISSFISLGCMFQLFSMFMRRQRVKSTVIALSIINQLLFLTLYVIPVTKFSATLKTIAFVVVIFSAYIIYNFAHPKKINWLMSLIEDKKRGEFTANKEIVSLITGMIFTYSMSFVFDSLKAVGKTRTAFIISAVVMLIITTMHTLTMLFTVEPTREKAKQKSLKAAIKSVIKNKPVLKVAILLIIYNVAHYCSSPFFGTYLIGELKLSLNTVSTLIIFGNISRAVVSRLWGHYADKTSFANMIEKCFFVIGIAFFCHAIAVPENAFVTILLYHIVSGIALGGLNSALTNMVFDYSDFETRADSLAICQATAGLTGFITTIVASFLVTFMQNNGNQIFGVTIYAQQLLSALSLLIIIGAIIFLRCNFLSKKA